MVRRDISPESALKEAEAETEHVSNVGKRVTCQESVLMVEGLEEAVEHAISVEKKGISRESVRKGAEVALRQEVQ